MADEGRQRSWLAKKLGIDSSLISRWATGSRVPRINWRERIEEVTLGGVPASAWPDPAAGVLGALRPFAERPPAVPAVESSEAAQLQPAAA